jgi:hypothetical protein
LTLKIHKNPIEYYVDRLREGSHFALVGYSDAEWFSILRRQLGNRTGLGQILHGPTGDRLLNVLKSRHQDADFLFSVPGCIWEDRGFIDAHVGEFIEATLSSYDIQVDFYERDMVLDDLAEAAGLYCLIQQLQSMDLVIIGNRHLRELDFLGCKHFVEVSSPNLHLQENGIENAVAEAKRYGKPATYLVSAGMSAPLIIDQLYDEVPSSFFLDCGSIWDAFVGIGGQREWRAKLYSNPIRLEQWKHDNICGREKS